MKELTKNAMHEVREKLVFGDSVRVAIFYSYEKALEMVELCSEPYGEWYLYYEIREIKDVLNFNWTDNE